MVLLLADKGIINHRKVESFVGLDYEADLRSKEVKGY